MSTEVYEKRQAENTGFTMVELIVVLGIAVVITGVLFAAIDPQSILAKSRDAERIQDLDELDKALQLALADDSIILEDTTDCETCNSFTGSPKANGEGWVKFTVVEKMPGLSNYLPRLPVDPFNVEPLVYTFAADYETQKYKISVPLESPDNANRMRLDGGSDPNLYEVGTNLDL